MQTSNIILASSSPYRKQLLEKLPLNFIAVSPEVDESAKFNESAEHLALRLARSKAKAIQQKFKQHFIIASDQVALLDNQQLTKPGNSTQCINQLSACSGRRVDFFTSICVLDSAHDKYYCDIDKTTVWFKTLSAQQIEKYVDLDKAYDCAGGFKVEGLGIALFEGIESQDPNALIGLPMIKLITLLSRLGVKIL